MANSAFLGRRFGLCTQGTENQLGIIDWDRVLKHVADSYRTRHQPPTVSTTSYVQSATQIQNIKTIVHLSLELKKTQNECIIGKLAGILEATELEKSKKRLVKHLLAFCQKVFFQPLF